MLCFFFFFLRLLFLCVCVYCTEQSSHISTCHAAYFLTHLHVSCSFFTSVLNLSAWCEREERAREMRGKRAIAGKPRHRIFPSQALPLRCVRWLVLTLTAHCNIPPLSSYCQAISSGCLLFCLRLTSRCASRLGLGQFTHSLISSYSQESLTSSTQFLPFQ